DDVGVVRQRLAIRAAQHDEAQRVRAVPREELADRDAIAQGLGHLLDAARARVDDLEHPVVHEEPRERPTRDALALGDLVFVVREDQVAPAAVDVDLLAEVSADHRRALDVPAGPARAPRARPRRLAGAVALPEREVSRVLLRTRVRYYARSCLERP